MNSFWWIVLLFIVSLSAGCTSTSSPYCPATLTPSIVPGLQSYSRVMSSAPGLPLSPDTGTPFDPACQYRYRWQASDGSFLFWGPDNSTVREAGSIIETDNRTVYWTWHDPDLPFSGHDVTISLEILGPEGITLIGRTELAIGWDDETAAVKQAH